MAAVQEPAKTRAAPAQAARSAQRATWLGILALLAVLAVGRILLTAFSYGVPAWFDEELNPLINLLARGEPITQVDARQYGVVVFLVFDPVLRLLGPNLPALASYATWVALPCAIGGFVLVARRYAAADPAHWLLLMLAWSSAVPLLYVIAQHMVDSWQLLFVSASLFFFTGSVRQQRFAGLPLAAATLTKLLPAVLLLYLFVRAWRAAVLGLVGIAALLAVGQVLYGPLMGFGYPLAMLSMGGDTIARWSTHFENNSVRGLLFKLAAGFRLQGDTTNYVLDPALAPFLNVAAYVVTGALVAYLLFAAWRGRRYELSMAEHIASASPSDMRVSNGGPGERDSDSVSTFAENGFRSADANRGDASISNNLVVRRSVEFSLALVTMLLVSPHTAQDYLVTVLPVLGVWLYLWSRALPRRWSPGMTLLGAAAALLIGVFVPMNLAARALPINWLLTFTANAHNALFVDQIGSAIGAYDFFGFPGIGLLLAWVLLVRLERQSLRPHLAWSVRPARGGGASVDELLATRPAAAADAFDRVQATTRTEPRNPEE